MDFREKIAEDLAVLQKQAQQERNVFRARAYGKVIAAMRSLDQPVRSMKDVEGIPGIGEGIRRKIQEILETGKLDAASRVRADPAVGMKEALMHIYGVGPVKAAAILEKHPVQSIEELRRVAEKHPKLLNDKQKIGLAYYEDFLERIPRKEVETHRTLMEGVLHTVDARMTMDIVGSFRRGKPDSGDIDVLIGYPDSMSAPDAEAFFQRFVEHLRTEGYITDILALGPKKCMCVCKVSKKSKGRRLDLLLTPAAEYPYALLYFTGSDRFNIAMRRHAQQKGYTLNEHAMMPIQEGVPAIPTMSREADIFAFLGVPFVAPAEREKFRTHN
jgi:DNA polymerase/3'-5' exonuclease PolX